jgi:hypothetical protein
MDEIAELRRPIGTLEFPAFIDGRRVSPAQGQIGSAWRQ